MRSGFKAGFKVREYELINQEGKYECFSYWWIEPIVD